MLILNKIRRLKKPFRPDRPQIRPGWTTLRWERIAEARFSSRALFPRFLHSRRSHTFHPEAEREREREWERIWSTTPCLNFSHLGFPSRYAQPLFSFHLRNYCWSNQPPSNNLSLSCESYPQSWCMALCVIILFSGFDIVYALQS